MSVVRGYTNTHDRISGAGTPVPRRDFEGDELGTAPAGPVRLYTLSPEERAKYPPVRPTRADLVADLEVGLRPPEIAEKWGITEGRVRKLLAIYQLDRWPPRPAETEGDEEMERRAVQLTEAEAAKILPPEVLAKANGGNEEVSAPAPAGGGIEWWPGPDAQVKSQAKSEVTFKVPKGAYWRDHLTPEIYLELKKAGWNDVRIMKACRIPDGRADLITAWKKQHGLAGLKLRADGKVQKEILRIGQVAEEIPGVDEVEPPSPPGEAIQGEKVMPPAEPAPKPKKTPGTNLPEGVRHWSQVISREQMEAVNHLDSREAAAKLGIPQYAYKSLKRQYGLARPADRRVLTVTEAALEAAKLFEDLECCRRLLNEIEGLSGGVILVLEQLANDARRKLDAIKRVKVVI